MLTTEALQAAGADVKSGIARCANNEAFYLRIAQMVITSETYDALKQALEEKDLKKGFECAHSLKGVVANASLDNLLKPISEMTELLRAETDMDYSGYVEQMYAELEKYKSLL